MGAGYTRLHRSQSPTSGEQGHSILSCLETMGKVAYTVGRFQPPTIGHKQLIEAVKAAAGPGGKAYIFVSSTMSPKDKNPLTSAQKMPILRNLVPSGVEFVDTQVCKDAGTPCRGAIAAFYYLMDQKGHEAQDITLVVGDDRKPEFGPTADIWKRREEKDVLGPGNFVFLSSAKRNPDLEVQDPANMSGTKARQYVKLGRKDDFYRAIGYTGPDPAADTAYAIIAGMKRGGRTMRGGFDDENLFSADDERTGGRRKTRRKGIRRTRR